MKSDFLGLVQWMGLQCAESGAVIAIYLLNQASLVGAFDCIDGHLVLYPELKSKKTFADSKARISA